MPTKPQINIDLKDKEVQKAACMIQKSFRGHRLRSQMKKDGPPRFTEELKDVDSFEDSTARIVGRLAGFPDPTVQWFRDGQELKEGPKYSVVFEPPDLCALVVKDTQLSDIGSYTCKLYNHFGVAFDSAKLNMQGNAKIIKGPPNQTAKKGSTVVMEAKIGGLPEPDAGWAKDGEDIDEDDRVSFEIEGDTTTLTIRNCSKKDNGKYEVYVENSCGYDHSFARLDVK